MEESSNGNASRRIKPGSGSAGESIKNNTMSHSNSTDSMPIKSTMEKANEDNMIKLLQALKTIQDFKIEHLEHLLKEHISERAATGFYGQDGNMKLVEANNWTENRTLGKSHEDLKQMMEKELKSYQTQLQEQERHLKEKERQLQEQSRLIQEQSRQLQEQSSQLQEQSRQIQVQSRQIQDQGRQLQEQRRQLQDQERQLHEKDGQLEKQRQEMRKVYKEKEDALSRLSRHMGIQILDGNPNITDLSDPNRPSKLAERYVELYDNEWTNAFEDLTSNDDNDKDIIDVLRIILWETYNSAFKISQRQMEEAEYMLSRSSKPVSTECKRLLKEAQKHIDIEKADSFKNALEIPMMKNLEKKISNKTRVDAFAIKCFHLCWFMSIQDPPIVLANEPSPGSGFDTNMYKCYTASGDRVDYVVWPALLLHINGPVLAKGIAQPFPRPRAKSAFPLGEKSKANGRTFDKFSQSLHAGKLQERTASKMIPYEDGCGAQLSSSLQKK